MELSRPKLKKHISEGNFLSSKNKKPTMKNFLIFQEIELSSPKLKIVLIFSQKKALLVIWEIELFKKNTSYISGGNFLKKVLTLN